ncbi:MAG: radical SAM family heme chaperone HemW [Pseudomonadota bacterium]
MHWPFCRRICPYCDFTVAKARDVDAESWIRALTEDLRLMAERYEIRPLRSIYFGGGTPSLIPERVAAEVIAAAVDLFGLEEGAEITIEANPDDQHRFDTLRSLGFGRLSLGVQSLDDQELEFLGRNHDASSAYLAIDRALMTFDRVSLDFIYALPGQSLNAWEARLSEICALGATHLSLYQLTIEPETAFGHAKARGHLVPMPDDRAADFYEITQDLSFGIGLPAYEVSNHAVPGDEARHNALYWDDADWIGIGPGAAGRFGDRLGRFATDAAKRSVGYPAVSAETRIEVTSLTEHDHLLEVLGGGLRPVTGLHTDRLGPSAAAVLEGAEGLADQGLLTIDGKTIAISDKGRLLTDYIAARLASSFSDVP